MRGGFLYLTLIVLALIAPRAAAASTYRWQADASGVWNVPDNWEVVEGPAGVGYPNLAGDVAVFDEPISADRTVTIPDTVTITIGRLTVDLPVAPGALTITAAGTGLLVLDNLGEDAVLESLRIGEPVFLITPIQLAADLTINGGFQTSRGIGESGGARNVTITGGSVSYVGVSGGSAVANTYTGTTTVTHGSLRAESSSPLVRLLKTLVVGDGVGAASSARVLLIGPCFDSSAAALVRIDGLIDAGIDSGFSASPAFRALTVLGGRVAVNHFLARVSVLESLTMEGGDVVVEGVLWLDGHVNATSTAAGPAVIRPGNFGSAGAVYLWAGNHDFTIADGPQAIDLRIDATVSQHIGEVADGLTKLGAGVMQMSGASYSGATSVAAGELIVTGNVPPPFSAFTVAADAVLSGTGTLRPGVTVAANGSLSPGRTGVVGTMGSGPVVFAAGARFVVDIPSTVTFDHLEVTGAVTLGNATLDVTAALFLSPAASFTIIDNDGSDPVTGTFAGLAEGAQFTTASGAVFTISYQGGDGNDVVLSNPAPVTYFLSEGATGTFFDEDVLIANPNTVPAPVTMTFFLPGSGTIVRQATVPAQARLTVAVDGIEGLEGQSTSVEVRSDDRLPLAVERTMFWDSSRYGGHTANAVSSGRQQWFFAEGAQGFFDTYLLIANPNPDPVNVTVSYLREHEPPYVTEVGLYGASRTTIYAGNHPELVGRSFGIKVDSPVPVTAERAMYFATTPERLWSGGTDNVGSPAPTTSWFHPEGASGTFFSTFILIANPAATPAHVTLKFLMADGTAPIEITKEILPEQRLTVNPATEGIARLQNAAFSTVVTSDVPVVSERAMYWNADDTVLGEGHASSGLTEAANAWALAEGRVGGPNAYTTYILLANPGANESTVTVTFLRESGTPVARTYAVPANSRFNIDVGSMVPELQNESFGTFIQVTDGPAIAVERSMYWNVDGRFWAGGTNAVGSMVP